MGAKWVQIRLLDVAAPHELAVDPLLLAVCAHALGARPLRA